MATPIPLTVDVSAPGSPAGAIPVTIAGLETGGGEVEVEVSWADVTGKPSTFAPATHTHAVADVSGLQAIITDLTDRIVALETAAGE